MRLPRLALLLAALAGLALAQASKPAKPRVHTVRATVEVVNEFAHTVRVLQEAIPGYSDARAATYDLDELEMAQKLMAGDKIVATIHEDDTKLYDIRVVRIDDRVYPPAKPK